ncbi:alpha-N-arabinofuranosidase [Bifidobacterium myosotis]|uniref:Alpha-N-arabinofuranosidase n=2 Tax=Bifidobacterium myosotis TaxID=1630166 RepID=A0A5M9ZNQ0_9BIFI|nr:family 43 glycosylhydrolase [Bifidobacterium myosotis]KAA8829059.1 alpha-N-arabinofuranosidase [Bifidobacterium myosotis]
MEQQAYNPYLPAGEYIPDTEPYVFGDRVYIYGSHDRFGAPMFCVNDYVCWSTSVSDLAGWRYEGVIYRKNQDPKNRFGLRLLFAPDVAIGPDDRYYLYYAFDFMGLMGVAVADSPAGPYEFYGHVHHADGTLWGRRKGDSFPFDPGVFVDDDSRVYLYSGFYTPVPALVTGGRSLGFDGGYVLELEPDMVTIRTPEKLLFPKSGPGSFPGHEFFEASSMRKWDGKYYFVYSSRLNHELCYAVSDCPTEGFRYGGTLVSIGDVGLSTASVDGEHSHHGQEAGSGADAVAPTNADETHASNYTGNTHGGMLRIGDDFYTFYHRQTNRSSYARQTCAEKLHASFDEVNGEWRFAQTEVTSCGLNGGPLQGNGRYEARIACNLWSRDGAGRYDGSNPAKRLAAHPYFTQDERDAKAEAGPIDAIQYIANMRDGAVAGFKYFDFCGSLPLSGITVTARAHCGKTPSKGSFVISKDPAGETVIAEIPLTVADGDWQTFQSALILPPSDGGGKPTPLYFRYMGTGSIDFLSFELTVSEGGEQ